MSLRSLARAASIATGLAVALLLPSCNGEVGAPGPGSPAPTTIAQTAEQPPDFLSKIPDAPETVAHSGRRRVSYSFEVDGAPQRLVYEERVTSAGDGRYAIELVSLAEPSLSTAQREVFDELQRTRQGFFFKYRDLRVRDVDLFLANYSVHVVPGSPVVAGVACVDLEITARHGSPRSYRLAVDPETGLVLRAIEHDAAGQEIASTTFLDFTRTPVLENVPFFVERYPGVAIAESSAAHPQLLPEGYRADSSDMFQLAGDTYVRRIYGDGLENIFFLERRDAGPTPAAVKASAPYTVRIAEVGAYRIAEVAQAGGDLFVVGKLSETDVLGILRSAL